MEMNISFEGKRSFKTVVRGHEIRTDLPQEQGGDDKAPTSSELFIASLGTCIGIYVASYMRTVNLNSEALTVNIDWEFAPNHKKIAQIKVSISVPNADLGERKKALLAAAEKCVIHNTLREYPNIDIDIKS